MRFRGHGLAINGKDFFDLMARQMMGVHEQESSNGDLAYEDALQNLLASVDKDKRKAVHAVDDAVGLLAAEAEEQSYKNGFADAICMILQAAMHGK